MALTFHPSSFGVHEWMRHPSGDCELSTKMFGHL